MRALYSFIALVFLFSPAFAGQKSPVPRFASLRPNEVNARVGPGPNYPVDWVYSRAGFPIEVTAEFDTWREIRDADGDKGWVHQSMLSKKRRVIVQGGEALLYKDADKESLPLVRIQKGVILDLIKSQGEWCQVKIQQFKGWVLRSHLWGVYPEEKVG